MIPWLADQFPPVDTALKLPNGLLAAGGDLSAARLLDAYQRGIFPWFNADEPVLWWSPDPRMTLIPNQFKCAKSLRKTLRNLRYHITLDLAFEQVMHCCSAPRRNEARTWINADIIAAYCELYRLGHAHSIEVWLPKNAPQSTVKQLIKPSNCTDEFYLVGGLYGVAIGKMFYGESMFSRINDGSKIALAHLAKQLDRWGFGMIDCQMHTTHLASLGARELPRSKFIEHLQELVHCVPQTKWQFDTDLFT